MSWCFVIDRFNRLKLFFLNSQDSQPQFLYEDNVACKTLFTWQTAAACPINDQADVETDCTVKNAVSGNCIQVDHIVGGIKTTAHFWLESV